jgi:NDP-sugar pyrophosphorylase family protein
MSNTLTTLESASPAGDQTGGEVGAVILAGSHNWTGSSFGELRARPLLPVAQRPIIEYVLEWLKDAGVPGATICANGSTGMLRAHLGDGQAFGMDVRYHEDQIPRGAAGCVKDAGAKTQARTLVVTDGTVVPVADLRAILAHHAQTHAALTIVARERESVEGLGSPLIPVGLYVFSKEVLDAVPGTSFQDIKEALIPRLYRSGQRIEVFAIRQGSPHVMNPATYLAANHWMIERLAAQFKDVGSQRSELMAPATAWVDPDALIVGPVILGASVRVLAGATIVGPTSIGEGTTVEAGAVVARSVVWNNCTIGEGAAVDNCVLTDNTKVPPGATLARQVQSPAPEPRSWRSFLPTRRSEPQGAEGVIKPVWS